MLNVITVGESLHLAGQPQRGRGTDPKWLFCRLPLKFFSGQMSVFRAPPSADPSRGWIKIVSYQNCKMDPERPPWENEPISAERKLQRLRTHIMQSAFFFFFTSSAALGIKQVTFKQPVVFSSICCGWLVYTEAADPVNFLRGFYWWRRLDGIRLMPCVWHNPRQCWTSPPMRHFIWIWIVTLGPLRREHEGNKGTQCDTTPVMRRGSRIYCL